MNEPTLAPTSNHHDKQQCILPIHYVPSQNDVICKKGREAFNHVGNYRFRVILQIYLGRYEEAPNKTSKSVIVDLIVAMIREHCISSGGGFVRFNAQTNRWFEIGDAMAREKVGYTLRQELCKKDPSHMEAKRRKRRNTKRQRTAVRNLRSKQIITSAIKEADNLIRQNVVDDPETMKSSTAVIEASSSKISSEDTSNSSACSSEKDEDQPLPFPCPALARSTTSQGLLAQAKLMPGESRSWFDENQIKSMNPTVMHCESFDHQDAFGNSSSSCSSLEDEEEPSLHVVRLTTSEILLAQPKLIVGESRSWFDEDQIQLMQSTMLDDMDDEGIDHDTYFGANIVHHPLSRIGGVVYAAI